MRITFDVRNTGLGNNGGSLTIVQSANTLQKLGNDVCIIGDSSNQYKWTKLETEYYIVKKETDIPSADIIIATGYHSVVKTVQALKRCGVKVHWIRGWETWLEDEEWIVKNVLRTPTVKVVNSIGLQKKLQSYGISSIIVYPGYDLDKFFPQNIRRSKSFVVGGLYVVDKHENTKRTKWILDVYRELSRKHSDIKLWMFGISKQSDSLVSHYLYQPNIQQKNWFYNHVDVWLSSSVLEGLHMPPAEAMMTECPVIGVDSPLAGTQDYLEHMKTGIVTKNNFERFFQGVCQLYEDGKLRRLLGKNARKKIEEMGSREKNMKKFVKFLETLL